MEIQYGVVHIQLSRTTRETVKKTIDRPPELSSAEWDAKMKDVDDECARLANSIFFGNHYSPDKLEVFSRFVSIADATVEQLSEIAIGCATAEACKRGWPLDAFYKSLQILVTIGDYDDKNCVTLVWLDADEVDAAMHDPELVKVDAHGNLCAPWATIDAWRFYARLPEMPASPAGKAALARKHLKKMTKKFVADCKKKGLPVVETSEEAARATAAEEAVPPADSREGRYRRALGGMLQGCADRVTGLENGKVAINDLEPLEASELTTYFAALGVKSHVEMQK